MNKQIWTIGTLALFSSALFVTILFTKQESSITLSSQVAAISGADSGLVGQSSNTNSITQYGITWTFDKDYPSGQFLNGDYWVLGPVTITSISPDWDGTKNGSMIDPVPTNSQGYDTRAGGYSESKRVTFPVTISQTSSLVSTIGLTSCVTGGAAQCLNTAAVLTVVTSPPDSNSFRPSYVAGNKKIWNTSQVRYELLPKLAVPPGVTLPNLTNAMTRVWLDHGPKVTGAKIHPQSNMPPYPRDSSAQVSTMALMALLNVPENRDYTNRLIQLGIDLYDVALTNGDAFRAYGGFGSGRKWPILFAGIMLNDASMQSPPKFISGGSNVDKFGEDGHTSYGKSTAIYPNGKPLWGQDCIALGHTEPFFTNHDCRDPNGILEAENMQNGGSYRTCCTSYTWIGAGLAAQIMKAKNIWDHPAFFDYIDRWVAEPGSWSNSSTNFYKDIYGYGGDGKGFMMAMWKNYRGADAVVPADSGSSPSGPTVVVGTPTPPPAAVLTPTPPPTVIPTPTPDNTSPISGSCGTSNNTCTSGSLNNLSDSDTQYLWQCMGVRGGSSAQCSININQVPVPSQINGYCGPAENRCISGTFRDSPDSVTHSNWSCIGQNGGSNINCNISKQITFPANPVTSSSQTQSTQSIFSPKVSKTSVSLIPVTAPTKSSFASYGVELNVESLQKFLDTKGFKIKIPTFIEKLIFYLNVLLLS